jgi:hypothetical protein
MNTTTPSGKRYFLTLIDDHTRYTTVCFMKKENGQELYILIYVDDLMIVYRNKADFKLIVDHLKEKFKLTDLGELKLFLGIEIERHRWSFLIVSP